MKKIVGMLASVVIAGGLLAGCSTTACEHEEMMYHEHHMHHHKHHKGHHHHHKGQHHKHHHNNHKHKNQVSGENTKGDVEQQNPENQKSLD